MQDLQMEKCLRNVRTCILVTMEKRGWNIAETAIRCDMSYRNFQSILYGERKDIKLSTLVRIANTFDVPLSEMIGGEEAQKEKDVWILKGVYATLKNYMTMRGGVAA